VTNTCPQNYKWTGKERDAETGNDNFDARYYSSTYGRFLSADWSAVPAPVPYANLTNPQTLNLYAIVRDNPESYADLDGHCCLERWSLSGAPVDWVNIAAGAGKELVNTVTSTANVLALSDMGIPIPQLSPSNSTQASTMLVTGLTVAVATMGEGSEALAGEAESTIAKNAAQGKAFQDAVFAEKLASDPGAVQNLTLKTESGTRTVMDIVNKDSSGNVVLTEAKSSATARLTPPQKAAHPEIAKSGAKVAGRGKPGYPGGTQIPPTKVNVERPKGPPTAG
jgi:RHS repeat-associated protein